MAYIPAATFPPHFHKPDGTLAIGCVLAAFAANTTTPTPLYLDDAGTSAGTTFTLNDRGEIEVSGNTIVPWLNTAVLYKFSLTDPESGLQWTVDDIATPVKQATESSPGIVQLYDDVDSSDSTLAATANAVRIAYELAEQAIAIASAGVPVGSEIMWPTTTPPDATWLECDGGSLLTADYPEYFAVVGYMHGGSGASFNKPDWRGKFPRGWAHGSTLDPDRASRTDRGDGTTGDNIGTNQADELENHSHTDTTAVGSSTTLDPVGFSTGFAPGSGQVPIVARGGNETRPVNMTRMIIVKVKSALD
jgi:microcystin-dependent protein